MWHISSIATWEKAKFTLALTTDVLKPKGVISYSPDFHHHTKTTRKKIQSQKIHVLSYKEKSLHPYQIILPFLPPKHNNQAKENKHMQL